MVLSKNIVQRGFTVFKCFTVSFLLITYVWLSIHYKII
jgi:hypothetical protein